ncbi:thiopeptide-type bacteriocin biosynthesis protein [Pedobacter gandavensis]|uniref:lantibiotic dehydratase n=1 Tax=Pedobacter gandavensis TaxID=2679963 RepID=UPI002479B5EB|nr:lantibiotic dehydratase [Pedobacter gandavensis]WGQ10306.1 thiopeptide-type bacteriocin biosynthesis protein [Pedobacter gandavensis]
MDVILNISPVVLLRIPAFSMCDELVEVWEDLKGAIYHSSSDFYEKIKHVPAAGITDLDSRTQYTIWKYYNRSKYRGTPFGNFAGFAVAGLGEVEENVVFSKEQYLHRFKDWSGYKSVQLHENELNASDRLYLSNSSHYTVADHIRFISMGDQVFELSEIAYSGFIQELLVLCAEKASYSSILEFAGAKSVTEEVLLGILKAMVEAQLLFTELNANIIGPDYFGRIQKEPHQNEQGDYLIAERKMISGKLSKSVFKHLPSCINTLLSLNLSKVNEGLKRFATDFQKRYEGQEVPLLKILDPELGLGYGQFTSAAYENDLAQELSSHSEQRGPAMLPWIGLSTELLKAILKEKPGVLQLKDLMKTNLQEADLKPANSFSILARFAGDLLVLDNVGGCTANALSGRFTLASETLTRHCKSIAAAESNANPEVIFFDLAYMAEGRVDNINRRKQIYEHELPILNYSCSEQLIALQDILVTVQRGEVILFSKKYGKRLIPRLASAYNYTRSDLSVYRFLCDLQHQGIQSQLLFDVQELLPGLDYYPRIQYENLVLSAAKWRIKGVELKGKDTLEILDQLGVSRYFSVGEGDQTLCFDRTKSEDLSFFKQYANQYNDFVITEVIVSDSQLFMDDDKKCYFTQVLLAIGHQEQLYPGYSSHAEADESQIETIIMPGKDWLSYEIYCHPDRCEFLLSTLISAFISEHAAAFKTWFFIRYNDPGPHLRLRFQLKDRQTGYFYMTRLMELLAADLQEGLIKDVQLKTYYREIARYGVQQMGLTECHFGRDSEYALEVIAHHLDSFSIYANCIGLMKAAIGLLSLEKKAELTFIKGIQRSFEKEHELTRDDFKMVNREWTNFKRLVQSNDSALALHLHGLQQSFLDTLRATAVEQRPALFCSLFHMHINRLFSEQQRTHELIIYSFLYKQLQMDQQRLVVV